MSLKEKFENHPAIFGLTLLAVGFASGITVFDFIRPTSEPSKPTKEIIFTKPVNCVIEGVERVESSHGSRVKALLTKLTDFEAKASDQWIIDSYQEKYLQSANRIREDIKSENAAFKDAISILNSKCEEE